MPETASSASEIASLLADYVPKADYEATLDALNTALTERDTLKTGHDAHAKRVGELEGKVRSRAARDAYDKVADKLKINPDYKDDVFALAKIQMDGDEPDVKAMEKHLSTFLGDNKRFAIAEDKPKKIAAGEGSGRGSSGSPTEATMKVSRSQLANAVWKRENQQAVAKARQAGLLEIEEG